LNEELAAGAQISHYRVTGKLGAGGMGEVYRGLDSKLNREVAIKVLPEGFAQDPDRVARFQREAQILASLNHPNIAAIYGRRGKAPLGWRGTLSEGAHACVKIREASNFRQRRRAPTKFKRETLRSLALPTIPCFNLNHAREASALLLPHFRY